jgi:hypothetical protein
MALVWTAEAALLAGAASCAVALVRLVRQSEEA